MNDKWFKLGLLSSKLVISSSVTKSSNDKTKAKQLERNIVSPFQVWTQLILWVMPDTLRVQSFSHPRMAKWLSTQCHSWAPKQKGAIPWYPQDPNSKNNPWPLSCSIHWIGLAAKTLLTSSLSLWSISTDQPCHCSRPRQPCVGPGGRRPPGAKSWAPASTPLQ